MPEVADFVPELVCLGIDVAICGVISQSWIFVHITLYTLPGFVHGSERHQYCTETTLCRTRATTGWAPCDQVSYRHWRPKVFLGTRDLCGTFVPSIFHRFQFGESPCSASIFRPHLCSTFLCCCQRRSWLPGCWAASSLFDWLFFNRENGRVCLCSRGIEGSHSKGVI